MHPQYEDLIVNSNVLLEDDRTIKSNIEKINHRNSKDVTSYCTRIYLKSKEKHDLSENLSSISSEE